MEKINLHSGVQEFIRNSTEKISEYFGVSSNHDLTRDAEVRSICCGHNSRVYLIDFFHHDKTLLGSLNIKFSKNKNANKELVLETGILGILKPSKVLVPRVIDSCLLSDKVGSYIILEHIKGNSTLESCVTRDWAERVLESISEHEEILDNNKHLFDEYSSISGNLTGRIDFSGKVTDFLKKYLPQFTLKNSLDFLNEHLNNEIAIRNRSIVTDRSGGNIFITKEKRVSLIDFSTVRIGTRFDNWIQFIDDPRIEFEHSREELIELFFKKKKLTKKTENAHFHAAAIYTNLLQAIFTYEKDPELSLAYLKKVNASYATLTGEKQLIALS